MGGLGERICIKFAQEGAHVAINYCSGEARAVALKERILAECEGVKVVVVQGDMAIEADCERVVKDAIRELGGLDVLIANAGYTRPTPIADLSAPTAADWDTTFAINVKSPSYLLRAALPTLTSNPSGGVFLLTSSIAGTRVGGSSLPYAVTKAAQLHLMRCMAGTQGPKVRVNAILPGLMMTEWVERFSDEVITKSVERAWLKSATDLDDAAQAFVDTAKNSSMTGQNIVVDSGLSN